MALQEVTEALKAVVCTEQLINAALQAVEALLY
jgi:hypothetical protein